MVEDGGMEGEYYLIFHVLPNNDRIREIFATMERNEERAKASGLSTLSTIEKFHAEMDRSGVKVNIQLMDAFYHHFASQIGKSSEITEESFITAMSTIQTEALSGRTDVKDSDKLKLEHFQQMFRAFDLDGNSKLSLTEIAVGMAKVMDGTDEERIHFAFKAYDTDCNGTIDRAELEAMLIAAKGYTREVAKLYANAAIVAAKTENIDEDTFLKLVKEGGAGVLCVSNISNLFFLILFYYIIIIILVLENIHVGDLFKSGGLKTLQKFFHHHEQTKGDGGGGGKKGDNKQKACRFLVQGKQCAKGNS